MNAFHQASLVETRSREALATLLETRYDGRMVLTDKGRLAREFQSRYGDIIAQHPDHGMQTIELKSEQKKTGNFFIEEWSNRSRFNRGWLDKLDVDLLFYHFVEDDELYIISFPKLKQWAFGGSSTRPRIEAFAMRRQSKYDQMNDTWGACVPIATVEREVGFAFYRPQSATFHGRPQAPKQLALLSGASA